MKILGCLLCEGELDIISESGHIKRVQCQECGYTSLEENKGPEITIIKRRIQ